jgi:integrase/recombinase XerD
LEHWEERKNDGEIFTPDTPIFRATYRLGIPRAKQVSRGSVSQIFKRVVESAKIPRVKKGRRYDIQLTHGNRKRFNTKLKLNNDVNGNVTEKLMAHKKGLDGVYLRPSRVEFFKEFVKAIAELTIDGTARKQAELEKIKIGKTELHEANQKLLLIKKQNEIMWKEHVKNSIEKGNCNPQPLKSGTE